MIPKNNEIRFEVSTVCNYNCVICARKEFQRKPEIMSNVVFNKLLRKILVETSQYTICTFSGFGEPLMDPNILGKIRLARKKSLKVLILTNGYFLDKTLFMKFNNLGVESIRISIYGNTKETYRKAHLKDAYTNIIKNIEDILNIKHRKTKIILTYNVIEGINAHETQDWINTWNKRVDLIEVWRPHNWANEKKFREIQETRLNTCGRPWNTPLQIQVDGKVIMCCFDFNGSIMLGNLNAQTLKNIFNSYACEFVKNCHETGSFSHGKLICEHCDQRNSSKDSIMIYNSKFDIKERVKKLSTSYKESS